ncbi:MAG: Ig-like domain-containing protein, partial [Anaerolineae bacterium]|nr:Ig-like domain-containing protein [Anaerolineae bacterium]
TPMTEIAPFTWEFVASAGEGQALQYKFTRGNWDMVENWGDLVGEENRRAVIEYGATGVMTITNTIHNWRDALVMMHYPPADAVNWEVTRPISVTFNRELDQSLVNSGTFTLTDHTAGVVIPGVFAFEQVIFPYDDPVFGSGVVTGTTVLFTPDTQLATTNYYEVYLTREGYTGTQNGGGMLREDYNWWFGSASAVGVHAFGARGRTLVIALVISAVAAGAVLVLQRRRTH